MEEKIERFNVSQAQIKDLRTFERKVRTLVDSEGGCTTTEYFSIKLDSREENFKEPQCKWNGVRELINIFNLK